MVLDKEFKEAVLNLSATEKDKLLLRLLKKDTALIDKLHFELVSDLSVDEVRANMALKIKQKVSSTTRYAFNPRQVLTQVRSISAEIAYHVKTTKDKFGDASLNLLLLNEFMQKHKANLKRAHHSEKLRKLLIYIISKAYRALVTIDALHEDYFLDLEKDLKLLGQAFLENQRLEDFCVSCGFDVDWLINADLPEDIKEIYKRVRTEGLLK